MVEVRGSNVGVASLRGVSCMAGPGISRKERRCGRKISQLRDGVVTSYTYDAADRLTGQQLAGAYGTYTMDSVGNITVKHEEGSSPMTMTYDAASRLTTLLQGLVTSTYTYDSNGNNTAINAGGVRTTLAYDYENRMRTYIEGANRTTYVYWADGLRRQQIVNGSAVTYVWDGSDYLQARGVSEVQTFETVNGQIVSSDLGGVERLLVPDPLGSVVKLLDASGNELYDAAYWPYGSVRSSTGVNDTAWGYVGSYGYHVDGSRRLYVRARVLDPVTGRWYTVDRLWPEELAYGYVDENPLHRFDPSGESSCSNVRPSCRCNPKPYGVNGVPSPCKSVPCYASACARYCAEKERIEKIIPALTGGDVWGIPFCIAVNRIYDTCLPSNPYYQDCHTTGGNGPGGQIGGSGCCVEAQIRLCCALGGRGTANEMRRELDFKKCKAQSV